MACMYWEFPTLYMTNAMESQPFQLRSQVHKSREYLVGFFSFDILFKVLGESLALHPGTIDRS